MVRQHHAQFDRAETTNFHISMNKDIDALLDNGYINARQHALLKENIRIFTKYGSAVKLDVNMFTKGGVPKRKASVKLSFSIPQ